ncbi:uncharacterized protein LOC113306356 [Papaver somniferum]|uniref:uncharacterized protein LOC113306356 n=1 Tax=Papaver somniferum TaxID=3469 RepID=UPI000E6FCCE1|nr:uncharacterized protein LOC113306356 [Papaver somniferum]
MRAANQGLLVGFFLLRKDGIHIDLVDMNFNFITVLVNIDSRSGHTLLNCMYGALSDVRWDREWDYLNSLANKYSCPWIVLGDLNFILRQEEKFGGNTIPQSQLDEVKNHLDQLDHFDMNYRSNPFTWSNHRSNNSLILERLDRALVNHALINYFPNAITYHLLSLASDHCHILLVTSREENNTKRPLRFNRCWFSDNSCKELIKENWATSENGSKAYKHTRCLYNVKVALRKWNMRSFGNFQTHINDIQSQLDNINTNMHDTSNGLLKKKLEDDLKHWYVVRQNYYMQRAKENVLSFDDKNTKYFHDKVKLRKRRTQIECLKNTIGIWLTDKSMISTELKDHFSKMSRTTNPVSDSSFLDVLTPCHMLKQINHNFVSLIPKSNALKTPADFRPITLSNASYKIISKLLASRLKTVMDIFISPYQAAFLSSGKITDNIVIAHELIDTMRKNKTKSGLMAVKLDMSKAFDRIEWKFLINILKKLGFNEHWCNLIEKCISTVSTSIFLNGCPGEVYYPTRGIRQGHTLSPNLFIICMDVLSKILIDAERKNEIQGIKVTTTSPSVSHLFFADDCLVFTRASIKSARNLENMLDRFSKFSGQAINFEKSRIAFSPKIEPRTKSRILAILKIKNLGLADKYLGFTLLLQRNKMDSFKHLEKSCDKRFFWNKKRSARRGNLCNWDNVAKPTDLGGLNIRKTEHLNTALLAKLAWRMLTDPDALWVQILKHKYFPDYSPLHVVCTESVSWESKGICRGLELIRKYYCWEIGDRTSIEIWKDKWVPTIDNLLNSNFASNAMTTMNQLIVQERKE